MWRSLLLHEFPDPDVGHFQALAGAADLNPPSLTATPASDRFFYLQVRPGDRFSYSFNETLDQVIGFSVRLRIRYPVQFAQPPFRIVSIGSAGHVWLRPITVIDPFFNPQDLSSRSAVILQVGNASVELGGLILSHRRFNDVRVDWHSSGQAHLYQDGKLAGYQNGFAAGAEINAGTITFGLPDLSAAQTNPRFQIRRVFVRALRRPDPLAILTRLMPEVSSPGGQVSERCHTAAIMELLAMADLLRNFMSQAHLKLSQDWNAVDDPAPGPFTAEAVDVRRLAMEALDALFRMLRKDDYSAADSFLDPFSEFLKILHEALPDQFSALAEDLLNRPSLPKDCLPLQEELRQHNQETIGPLLELFATAGERVKEIAGV